MLGPGRYLLGVLEVLLLGGFAWLGGNSVRRWLLPRFEGAPACLASAVVALALLIWGAELLGTFGWWDPVPYLVLVAGVALALWKFLARPEGEGGHPHPTQQVRVRMTPLPTLVAFLVAAIAVINFALEAKGKLSTGMTGFDSTWYHGPFAAGFFQTGNTWDLHFIAPQFLAWFYPANAEIFHAAGMLAFGRDVLSPLLNIGWFVGCLVACWCIGRPYRVGPWSLALGAIALSVPALADQAGEARNDIVGIFFLLSAVAIALNASGGSAAERTSPRIPGTTAFGPYFVVGLCAGLAAAATGTCATSPTAATRCPGSNTSARSTSPPPSRPSVAAKPTPFSATSAMAASGRTGSSPASTTASGSSGRSCSQPRWRA